MSIKGHSRLVDEIKSFFLLSTSFSDSLHVVYEGLLLTLLKLAEAYNVKCYEKLIAICKSLKHPRPVDSSVNTNIGGKMHANDYKFFLLGYGWKCVLLAGYASSIVELFKNLASIVGELEEKENKKLTVGRIFVLHLDAIRWTDAVAKIFGNAAITCKFHRFEHMIAECILIGKFWTHSCFPLETANILITKGVGGTGQPIPSIIRTLRKFQFSDLMKNIVSGKKDLMGIVRSRFPKICNKEFPDKTKLAADKNPSVLRKIVKKGKHVGWFEVVGRNRSGKLCNYLVLFRREESFSVGKITAMSSVNNTLTVTPVEVFRLKNAKKGEHIYKLGKDKQPVVISERQVLGFYCVSKVDNEEWVFLLGK